MAKQDALNIFVADSEDEDKLLEVYGGLIEAVQTGAVSEQIKNKNYSGNPAGGSVEIKRFVNATLKDYGSARTAGAGDKLENASVIINIDTDKEIVEELEQKDIALYGVPALAEKRMANQAKRITAYLDKKFFDVAVSEGTEFTFTEEKIEDKIEEIIQKVETTSNDFVDGVDRDMLAMSLSPKAYGKLRNYIDKVVNPTNGLAEDRFHNVKVYVSTRQSKDVIVMIDGAVAQLVKIDEYAVEKIPLTNAVALESFIHCGTKAIMADLIAYADLETASL